MRLIASCNEVVLLEDGPRMVIAARPGSMSATWLFVPALIAFILTANGGYWLSAGDPALGAGRLAGAALAGLVLWLVVRKRRNAAGAQPTPWLVLDRAQGMLLDAAGRPIAPLPRLRFSRQLQLGSSSQALACHYPGGSLVVARGNPFGEDVDGLIAALANAGLNAG